MQANNILLLGGSAGSIPVIVALLKTLPYSFSYSVIIVIHRLKKLLHHFLFLLRELVRAYVFQDFRLCRQM